MTEIEKKIVVFGAGKIGRSFIGQLFSRSGFEVVFIDVFEPIINELNRRRSYKVVIKAETDEVLTISNVRGVHTSQTDYVAQEIANCQFMAVSVGLQNLGGIFSLIANGLERRRLEVGAIPIEIIIAENLRNAADCFRKELKMLLPENFPISKLLGLVETSIGKMVPIMRKSDLEKDMLQVFAEPYNTLILDKKGFINPIPEVEGLAPKENMKAWVDRKSFIHNLGHAAAAYLGYLKFPEKKYVHEVLADETLHVQVRETMQESAQILMRMYPGEFSPTHLDEHIDDLLNRFKNKALGDTVFRIGADLNRKLSRNDRLVGVIKYGKDFGCSVEKILLALVSGFFFKAFGENGQMLQGDVGFHKKLDTKGVDQVLTEICGFHKDEDVDLIKQACSIYNHLINNI